MLIYYAKYWISFLLLCMWSPKQSSSLYSVSSWVHFSAGNDEHGDQVQLGLISKEWVHSKAPLQMGSPCYAPGDLHGAGVQQSPASFPNSLFYPPVSPGLATGTETPLQSLPARGDHFCVSLSRTMAGNPSCPGGSAFCKASPAVLPWGDALNIILPPSPSQKLL